MTYKPSKLGQADPVYWVYDESSSVGLCMQDCKSVFIVVMICATVDKTLS